MRKYLATIFGVALGIATAVFVAARADEHSTRLPRRPDGGA